MLDPKIKSYLSAIGSKGGRAGKGTALRKELNAAAGKAGWDKLTPEERAARVTKSARAGRAQSTAKERRERAAAAAKLRWSRVSPEERRARAVAAAKARWDKKAHETP